MVNEKELEKRMSLAGKAAIITGVDNRNGIGYATAKALLLRDARVMITSDVINNEIISDLTSLGGEVAAIPADITKKKDILNVVDKTVQLFGGVDILINCATSFIDKTVMEADSADWETSYRINMLAVFEFTRAVFPNMKKRGGGVVVNTTSGIRVTALPGLAPYISTMFGSIRISKNFADEISKYKIRLNNICCGNIWTEKMEYYVKRISEDKKLREEEVIESIKNECFLKRLGTPEDVAEAIAYVVSPAARFINAATIMLDGGTVDSGLH